jgi:nucleoside-diphosphate-sugar epimerase
MANVLIAGCGYVGTALGTRLAAEGHVVWGLRRRADGLPPGIRPLGADLTLAETLRPLPADLDFVLYTAAADAADDASYRAVYVDGLRNLLRALENQRRGLRRVFFTSSTGVYAQCSGAWVDETSPTDPVEFSGIRVLEGERVLLSGPFPATVLRLGGIYGPGRARLIERVRQGIAVCSGGSPLYTNRIHRDDCAGALRHLMTLASPDRLYLGVDHVPAEQCEVLRWIAGQLGVPPPSMEMISGSESQRRQSNKRCSNSKLVASGYVFRYPSFRDGYGPLLENERP